MPSEPLPFVIPDLSSFARALAAALKVRHAEQAGPPGHAETLDLVARALGHVNVQALHTALRQAPGPAAATAELPTPLSEHARKALAQFDAEGRLKRWPAKFAVQRLAMWVLWTRFDAKRAYTEREVNAILQQANAFGDHVSPRRALVDHHLLTRKADCSEYRKVAARPDDEVRALLHAWRARR